MALSLSPNAVVNELSSDANTFCGTPVMRELDNHTCATAVRRTVGH